MSIITIQRDLNSNVSFVRMLTNNNLSEVAAENYIANNQTAINALNGGTFGWFTSDMLLVAASDGNALFQFTDSTFSSLQIYGDQGSGVINNGLKNQIAFYKENGNIISRLETCSNGVLSTDDDGKPCISQFIPPETQRNINNVGKLTVGMWRADPIEVEYGGTGSTSFAPYAIVYGSQNGLLSLNTVGNKGDILVSNGEGEPPSFKSPDHMESIESGHANNLVYYSDQNKLSPINNTPNSVLTTTRMGIPILSNSLPEGLDIPGYVKSADLYNLVREIFEEIEGY